MAFCAVLDACVLVPSALRDVLLEIAVRKVYRPLWSEKIEEEVERTILRLHALRGKDEGESRGYVKRLRRQMNLALPDAQVQDWETLLPSVPGLPDPGDRGPKGEESPSPAPGHLAAPGSSAAEVV